MNDRINLAAKLATFSDYFQPRTVAQFNENDVMVTKLEGRFQRERQLRVTPARPRRAGLPDVEPRYGRTGRSTARAGAAS